MILVQNKKRKRLNKQMLIHVLKFGILMGISAVEIIMVNDPLLNLLSYTVIILATILMFMNIAMQKIN